MLLNFKLRTLLLAMTMTTIPTLAAADAGSCWDITAMPFVRHSGGVSCACPGTEPTGLMLGVDLGMSAIRKGTSALGGGPKTNCYQLTIIVESLATISAGDSAKVVPTQASSTIILRGCDLSSCGSALFGLVKWGGAACPVIKTMAGNPVLSWQAVGPCEDDPADPRQ